MPPVDSRMPLFFHPLYTDGISVEAPFPRDRYWRIAERMRDPEHSARTRIETSPKAEPEVLELAHSRDYIVRFLEGTLDHKERVRIGLRPWTESFVERALHIMGGALGALEEAWSRGGVAANMAGGTHHAHRDFGAGFCVFNDLAVCARYAIENWDVSRILIVDLDVHQGDGTAAILAEDNRCFTFSVHCERNFPSRKAVSDLDIALPPDVGDREYLAAVEEGLDRAMECEPELILFQGGVDPLELDRLGRLSVSRQGLRERNSRVFGLVESLGKPCVVFMGGGYCDPIDPSIDAFVDLFTQAAETHHRMISGRSVIG